MSSSWSGNIQPAYTQQAYRQYPSTPSRNSASGPSSRPRSFDSMAPGFVQRVAPHYDAQFYTTQDIYRDQLASAGPAGPRYGNDAYGGSAISGYDFNHVMAGPGGGLTSQHSQPQHNSDYSMPNIPYNNFEQVEANYAGYHFGAYQVPDPTMNFSPYFPRVNINQGASPTWRFDDCWVSHAEQDKIHLTIALKKT